MTLLAGHWISIFFHNSVPFLFLYHGLGVEEPECCRHVVDVSELSVSDQVQANPHTGKSVLRIELR